MQIRDRVTELRRVPAGELRPNPKNWRKHPQSQHDALRGVLAEVGIADALLARQLDDGSLMLIDGHLRADVDPATQWPVLILDVSEAEADKLLAAMAESDTKALDALLREVNTSSEAVARMLADLAKDAGCDWAKTGEIIEDEVPEPPAEPVTKPGDLWLLGEHRLLCGDSTKAEDVGRLLGGRKPFIMVTDPPYGVDYDADWRNHALRADGSPSDGRAIGKVSNDDKADWTETWKLAPCHVGYFWHADRHASQVERSIASAGFSIRCQLVWVKSNFAIGRGHYHWGHEPCWYAVRDGGSSKWCGDRTQSTTWNIAKPAKSESGHSTQKPVECMSRPIRNHGGKDDDVYDPFLGSGTTIIAAEQLGRRCYGLEIEPRYCDVIVQRWEKLTGRKAECQPKPS
jgi:DNA modification methylase